MSRDIVASQIRPIRQRHEVRSDLMQVRRRWNSPAPAKDLPQYPRDRLINGIRDLVQIVFGRDQWRGEQQRVVEAGHRAVRRADDRARRTVGCHDLQQYCTTAAASLGNLVLRQFETGGGRKAAAGINQLSSVDLGRFSELFFNQF